MGRCMSKTYARTAAALAVDSLARGAGVVAVLGMAAAFCAESLARWSRMRRDVRLLSQMDDHGLRDIGIARSDIERVVRDGRDIHRFR